MIDKNVIIRYYKVLHKKGEVKMSEIKYLRFKPGTGNERQKEIQTLIKYGVISITQVFDGDKHPERSAVYALKMQEGVSLNVLSDYFAGTNNVLPVDEEEFLRIKDAPYVRLDRKGNSID